MNPHPLFLSVVVTLRNDSKTIDRVLSDFTKILTPLVSDYELIVVDNASTDESLVGLKKATSEGGIPNLQVYALTKEVDADTCAWVGVENALGDFVAVVNPFLNDISFLPRMIESAVDGADVIFARNTTRPSATLPYRIAFVIFKIMYKRFVGLT